MDRRKIIWVAASGAAVVLGTKLLMQARTRQQLRKRFDAGVLSQLGGDPDDYPWLVSDITGHGQTLDSGTQKTRDLLRQLPKKWLRKRAPDRP